MYPYDFVRIDWQRGVKRRPAKPHDRFEGLSGRLTGTITTLTPLFIPEHHGARLSRSPYKRFLANGQGQAIIPGSSLKGLTRSLVETIGPGCWWLFKGKHAHRLPHDFKQCPQHGKLCIACRMFGLTQGSTSLLGHVGFEDAVCQQPVEHSPFYTIILSKPKPRHTAFYLDPDGKLAGRKFYFHHSTPPADTGKKTNQNAYIKPLDAGSVFTFSAHFDNLEAEELRLLLYALVLEPKIRHKIGYAKPAGLGSVEINLTQLTLIDYARRYTDSQGGKTVYTGDALQSYLKKQTAPYVDDQSSITLKDLRRIWAWPGRADLGYPSWDWFQQPRNRNKRLDQTP